MAAVKQEARGRRNTIHSCCDRNARQHTVRDTNLRRAVAALEMPASVAALETPMSVAVLQVHAGTTQMVAMHEVVADVAGTRAVAANGRHNAKTLLTCTRAVHSAAQC